MSQSDLDAFFSPRSIAVVGASATPGKIGAMPLRYLIEHGYQGEIYPINPARSQVQQLRAYASLRDIGKPVDLAIFAVPVQQIDAALDDAIAARAKSIVVFTAGFAEMGGEGESAQRRLARRARQAGIRLLGPNCLGFMNASAAVYATFSPVVSSGLAKSGAVGIVSQSGAFAAYAYGMARERNVGLSSWVATGNEVDIEVADCIAWMAHDPGTRIILAYMEGCKDGAKLKQALASARAAGKPVVMVKVGRTELGAQAAASHTAALAGNDAAFDTLLRQYGVWRARTIDEFFDIAHCFTVSGLPCNNKVGLLTVSGGVGALMADDAAEAGLDVAPMPESARALILARVPFAATRNPVDVTGQVTVEGDLLKLAAETMLRKGDYGSLVVFLAAAGLTPSMQEVQKSLARDLREAFPQRLVIFSALSTPAQQQALEQLGCLTFADPGRAIRVLAALGFLANQSEEPCSQPAPAHASTKVVLRPGAYNEADALDLLREHGIATPEVRRARTRDDAIREASALGFPVVMKVLSSQITHKSDMGGVVLNIQDAHQASRAYESIVSSVDLKAPGAVIEGVLVAPMVRAGVECILGVHLDPVVGPLVMLGAGGVHVELLKDVSFRVAPVDIRQARAMIDELKSVPLLKGYRGAPPADVEALADAIVRISEFAMAAGNSLEAIDLNPFCVLPEGQGVAALDAVILGRETESSANLQQLVLQTLPLFEMTRMRSANTARKHAVEGFAGQGAASAMRWVNQFTHTRNLLGPDDREVVTPNNDTLFTNAWLDLSDGPLVIDVPEMGDRYWTLGFLDAWTNPWAYAGRRTTGGAQQKILVHGPDWQGVPPKGMHIVSAPGADVWIIGRILVEHEPEDLQRVHALQNRFAIARLDGSSALKRVDTLLDGRQTGVPPAHEYVRVATQMILRNPSRHPVSAWPSRLDDLDLALEAVYAELREANGRAELGGGWTTAVSVRTDFGDDFVTRARVARNWIGTLGIEEAMYIMAEVDALGDPLDGAHRYLLRFPGDKPLEVDSFWSVTLYRRSDCLLAANPIGRHSIGDRTKGLRRDPDGGLSIAIQADAPGPESNWLPAPEEPFYLVLRLYQPRSAHMESRFTYPPVVRVDRAS